LKETIIKRNPKENDRYSLRTKIQLPEIPTSDVPIIDSWMKILLESPIFTMDLALPVLIFVRILKSL